MKIKHIYIFALILILGLFLRIYQLGTMPKSLQLDEASNGYNAYSILAKKTDEYGRPFPIFFKSWGDYKSPIQIYSTVPFILIFGLNETATRLTSVMYAMLGLIATYFLVQQLFKEDKHAEKIALFSMFFLAISPWHIQFSRIGWALMAFLFFTTFFLFLFLKSLEKPKLLPFAILSFIAALYTYFPARIFIPLLGIALFIRYFRFFVTHKNETLISLIMIVISLIPFAQTITSEVGMNRWKSVNVFTNPPKNENVTFHIVLNYLLHFSPNFLFIKGGGDMPGVTGAFDSIPGMGELYTFQFPLVCIGIYLLIKKKKKAAFLLFLLLLLYPTGSMFGMNTSPFARRSGIGVLPFQILSALGATYLLFEISQTKRYLLKSSIAVIIIISVSFFYYFYLYFIKANQPDLYKFQYGSREIVSFFSSKQDRYDELIMSWDFLAPQLYFNFYATNSCKKCVAGLPESKYNPTRKQLFAISPAYMKLHPEYTYKPINYVYYPHGTTAYILTEIVGKKTPMLY